VTGAGGQDGWRGRLRREIGWLLLAKLGALLVLWGLFFSPVHRRAIAGPDVAARLAIATTAARAVERAAPASPAALVAPAAPAAHEE
jgi:hypothetical protein